MALVGDTLSHAVLPGVALGFLFSGVSTSGLFDWSFDVSNITKNPALIFCGAVVAGVAGTFLVTALKQTTKIKEDSALGLTLASFFALGVCLLTMIQDLPTGNKSGIDKFMFGQAAAYLLTDRMHRMLFLAGGFGVSSGVIGAFISFLKPNIPTGPCMVLGASGVFAVAFFCGPRHGVMTRWWRHASRSKRVQRENTLKALFQVLERRDAEPEDSISLKELAERRRETLDEVSSQASALKQHGLVTLHEEGNKILFTPSGWQLACTIVRNHRLWELYLTNEANIAPDHVHDDAEQIEHVLGDNVVRELERMLDDTTRDPHGRAIPGFADIHKPFAPAVTGPSGYGRSS